ncbi:interferon-induced GTP-binding protein Mx1-like [Octodon degus]|uniref:Interferon-induced GTP-binding protein Mx1-like n=1 Tax=Octodon degus TaxID=10160 RepID=A0A6P3VB90_OCTDE|nr:interferon-induced GTP-binding protein Mx1-like [Octodon degus]
MRSLLAPISEAGSCSTAAPVERYPTRGGAFIFSGLGFSFSFSTAQNIITGDGLGIKDELISLEIGSPSVPDLTLIDLPGITRVPVGNQPADIGHQIKCLIKKYIAREATINLVVVPSNVDIATTEALSMAQEMDPEGDRTIGILTKPDLVDRGTEDKVVGVVQNLVCHLKKGYMMVKCRGQQDIQERLSLAEALQRERAFFEDHPHFRPAHTVTWGNTVNTAHAPGILTKPDLVNRGTEDKVVDMVQNLVCHLKKGYMIYIPMDGFSIRNLYMVQNAFTDVSEKNFTEFFNLYRTTKNKIEDIRLSQEEAAEKAIRIHFQMEKLVYSQDQAYRDVLQKVREEEAKVGKKSKGPQALTSNAMAEILQHLKAYSQEVHSRISTHIPLIIQYYVLQLFGQHLQNAMLQLLQDKESYAWLLKEKSDTSEKRKFLKEQLAQLSQARHKLASLPC